MMTGSLILSIMLSAACFFLPYCMGQSGALEEYYEMEKIVETQPEVKKELHIINVTHLTPEEIHERKRRAAAITGCPIFTQEYKNNAVRMKDRSISPWKFVKNYDSRRAPGKRYILDSVCLCEGCIDYKTGLENLFGVKSVGMELPRAVKLLNPRTGEYELSKVTLHFGCHCAIQDTNT